MKTWINGYSGRMGQEISKLMQAAPEKWTVVGGTSVEGLYDHANQSQQSDWSRFPSYFKSFDLLIDFSSAAGNLHLLTFLQKHDFSGKAILIGSTGLPPEQKEAWKNLAKTKNLRVLIAPNTSLGVLLTLQLSTLLGRVLSPLGFDIEILETHHRQKVDAPSGTARFLADGIAHALGKKVTTHREGARTPDEIGVSALRGGSVFGEHEIRYLGDDEEMLISHRALSRALFARGALFLGEWIAQKGSGYYRLEDIEIEEMLSLLRRV